MFQVKRVSGVGDDTARARTGKKWAEWFKILDAAGGRMMEHRDIVRLAREKYGLPLWWSQLLAVGYEQQLGRYHQRQRGARYDVYRSRRFTAPVDLLWAAWHDPAALARWLPGITFQVQQSIPHKLLHLDWPDGSHVTARFLDKPGPKVVVTHHRLPAGADLKGMKDYWLAALQRLQAEVSG